MEQHPGFTFCQSSAQYYKWLEEEYPQTFRRLQKRVKEGRWEIVGGTWVEPDGNLPSGEAFVRQFLYGKRYFKDRFGVDVRVAWMPDSFGYACTLPQVMRKSGIDFFLTQKMSWNDTTVFPYYLFRWIAPDGSALLAYQSVGTYSENVIESQILEQMKASTSRQQLGDLLVLFGAGDHGGGVTADMIERAKEFVEGSKKPKGVFQTAQGFFELLAKIPATRIPKVKDELYLQYHRGTYTTQARVKKNNRRAECLLETAEKFSTIAMRYAYRYRSSDLKDAWELLLLNQFHDVLPGSAIPDVYKDSEECFESIFRTADSVISEALRAIATRIDTTGDGKSLLVFNPLSWTRSGVVELPMQTIAETSEIHDEKGEVMPYQIVDEKARLIFLAHEIPATGYREFKVRRSTRVNAKSSPSLSASETPKTIKLENEFLVVEVEKATGHVRSIVDKKAKKETLKGHANVIQVFDDTPVSGRKAVTYPVDAEVFDAWEIYIHQQKGGARIVELNDPLEVRLLEDGPVRTRVSVKHKYAQEERPDSVFTQEVILYDQVPFVEFRIDVDWHASHRLAKVAFPLALRSEHTTYEAPYGFITRLDPTSPRATLADKAKYEVPGQKWMDHSGEDGSYGVSLLNDCKYGFDTADDVVRITLLRSAAYPIGMRAVFNLPVDVGDSTEPTDQGRHHITYAFYPHRSDFRKALVPRKAYELNYPLIPLFESAHRGVLPKLHSFISVEPDNIVLTTVKKAEDSDDIMLRFYETSAEDTKAAIRVDNDLAEVTETDLLENELSSTSFQEHAIELPVSKNSIKTLKLRFPS
jgi:alpha-mannosidase